MVYNVCMVIVVDCLDDTQEGRTIRILKNETLNIYIAVDISESIEEDQVNSAKKAVITLIDKVSNKLFSSLLKIRQREFYPKYMWSKFNGAFLMERAIPTELPPLQYAEFANSQQHCAGTGDVRLFLLIVSSV